MQSSAVHRDATARPARPLLVAMLLLLVVVLGCLQKIRDYNHGTFTFTLDDPYIHLALAEGIRAGHYGVNPGEYSAPASSIAWPFVIAPFATAPHAEYFVLALNVALALAAVWVFWRTLGAGFARARLPADPLLESALLLVFIVGTNLAGATFTGMEHVLQVLLGTCAAGFLVRGDALALRGTPWLAALVVALPLVRYECLAVSMLLCASLFLSGERAKAVLFFSAALAALAAFSWFLSSLQLGLLPSSVLAKAAAKGDAPLPLHQLAQNLGKPMATSAIVAGAAILWHLWQRRNARPVARDDVLLALAAALLFIQLMFGKFGSYNRYELYIWAFAIPLVACATLVHLARLRQAVGRGWFLLLAAALLLALFRPYLNNIQSIPRAAQNIYAQQYQMHRFVRDFYPAPVAVNDLGLVSYRNDNYVLDLWGLGSNRVLKLRREDRSRKPEEWMDTVTRERDVKLVMLYERWFHQVPPGWIKLGELQFDTARITPADNRVSFFATSAAAAADLAPRLQAFAATLPAHSRFVTGDYGLPDNSRDD